uniref:Phosphatidylglycerol--prolipoprotein diacylglyceryl transferase n=1 Tax=Candidatus Aschnera chinzeii TaxID=1485666 RepID=A0AAT9G4M3_9ENTR|nr:MAG: prolipoprotein diacylglyceryl transferase [Candidatus Aschnera chinzeii]
MYLLGYLFALYAAKQKIKHNMSLIKKNEIENLIFIGFLGVFFGGRIGYVLFYNFKIFLNHPLYIFEIWNGGMSFHGGLIGVICAIWCYSIIYKKSFIQLTDFIAPLIPFGICMGRIGNFINCELWGRVTFNTPWAMLFPNSLNADLKLAQTNNILFSVIEKYGSLPRHPSQLYEMFCEGIILFFILNIFILKPRHIGSISGMFLLSYGIIRFIIEFFREPDIQIGLLIADLTMGQILSFPMIISGIILLFLSYKNIFKKHI